MQLLLLDLFNSHFKRGLFRDVELSRDNYCNRIAVPECFACNGDLIADFHAMYICISVYIIFYYYNIILQIKKEKRKRFDESQLRSDEGYCTDHKRDHKK